MSDVFFSLNGSRAISGRVTRPMFGPWSADVVLASSDVLPSAVTLQIGSLKLVGTVIRMASFAGSRSARIVGGYAGWRKTIDAKGYYHAAGVKLSTVLEDAARSAGEKISVAADSVIGTNYVRRRDTAERVLKFFLDGDWWIDNDGVTQTKARDAKAIVTPFTVIKWSGARGRFQIATENYEDWEPGRTFTAPTVTGTQTISSVSIVLDNEGTIRLDVLAGETSEDRLIKDIRAIVKDELRQQHFDFVEYEITAAREGEVDCKPANGDASGYPALSGVPIKSGELGSVVTPTVGKKIVLFVMSADPTKVRVVSIEGPNQKSHIETSGDVEIQTGGITKLCGGGHFPAKSDTVDANFSTLITWLTSHTHGTGVGPTTPPLVPPSSATATAVTKLKTD